MEREVRRWWGEGEIETAEEKLIKTVGKWNREEEGIERKKE